MRTWHKVEDVASLDTRKDTDHRRQCLRGTRRTSIEASLHGDQASKECLRGETAVD